MNTSALRNLRQLAILMFVAAVLVGWVSLAYVGLAQVVGPVIALALFVCIVNMPPATLMATGASLAFWGAYAALGLPWFAAGILALPVIPLGVASLFVVELRDLFTRPVPALAPASGLGACCTR